MAGLDPAIQDHTLRCLNSEPRTAAVMLKACSACVGGHDVGASQIETLVAARATVSLHEHGNGRRDDLVDFLARRGLRHCAKKPGAKNARLREFKKLKGS
jgi:hypothetical protein